MIFDAATHCAQVRAEIKRIIGEGQYWHLRPLQIGYLAPRSLESEPLLPDAAPGEYFAHLQAQHSVGYVYMICDNGLILAARYRWWSPLDDPRVQRIQYLGGHRIPLAAVVSVQPASCAPLLPEEQKK